MTAAPYDGDRVCSPRQVRAGVPVDLDALVSATLGTARHGTGNVGEPVRTPAELARRLTSTAATSRIPVVEPRGGLHGDDTPPPQPGPYLSPYDDEAAPRGRVVGPLSLLVGLVLLVGLGLAGYQLFNSNFAGLTDEPPRPDDIGIARPPPAGRPS